MVFSTAPTLSDIMQQSTLFYNMLNRCMKGTDYGVWNSSDAGPKTISFLV